MRSVRFFTALFHDGGRVPSGWANLAQYSAGSYTIGNGQLARCHLDPADLPSPVSEDQVRAEIRSEIAAGECCLYGPGVPYPETDRPWKPRYPDRGAGEEGRADGEPTDGLAVQVRAARLNRSCRRRAATTPPPRRPR